MSMLEVLWSRRARALPVPSKSPPKAMKSLDPATLRRHLTENHSGDKRPRSCSPDEPRQSVDGINRDDRRPHKVRFIYNEEVEELKEQIKDLVGQRDNVQSKLQEVSDQFAQQEEENRVFARNLAAAEEALELAAKAAEQGHRRAQESENQFATALNEANSKIKAFEEEIDRLDRLAVHADIAISHDQAEHFPSQYANIEALEIQVRAQSDEIQLLRKSVSDADAALAEASEQSKRLRYLEAELFRVRNQEGQDQQLKIQPEAQADEVQSLRAALSNAHIALSEAIATASKSSDQDFKIRHLEAELSEARSERQKIRGLKAQVETQGEEIRHLRTALSDAEAALSASQAAEHAQKIRDLEAELADTRADHTATQTLKAQVETQGDEIQRLRGVLSDTETSLSESQAALDDTRASLSVAASDAANQEKKISDLEAELADANAERTATQELKTQVGTQGDEIQRLRGVLSDTEMLLSESRVALDNTRTSLSTAASDTANQEKKISDLEAELADAHSERTATQELKTQVGTQGDEIQRLRGVLSDTEMLLSESRVALDNTRTSLSTAASDTANQEKKISDLEAELADAHSERTATQELKTQVGTQGDEIQRLRGVLSDLEASLSESRGALVDARVSLSAAASDSAKQEKKIGDLEAELANAHAEGTATQELQTRVRTQGETIERLRAEISNTRSALSEAAASASDAEARMKEVEDLQTALAAAVSSSQSKGSEILHLSASMNQANVLNGQLRDEVIGLKTSLESAEAQKNLSAQEIVQHQANLEACLREKEQLQTTLQQQLDALRTHREDRLARDAQFDALKLEADSLNEAVSGLNERLRQAQDLLQEEEIRYRQLAENHNQFFDEAADERQRLTEQLERAEGGAKEERDNHQRIMEERDAALELERNGLERLRGQLEEGKRALEEQRMELQRGVNLGEVTRLKEIIEAQNEEIDVTEQTVAALRAEIEARDADDSDRPTGPSANALGKRREVGGSSSLLLALSRSRSKKRGGGAASTTPHRAPSFSAPFSSPPDGPMLARAQEDAELLTPRMSSEDTVRAAAFTSGTFRAGTSEGPSQQREGIAGPSNQQREGTPSRSSLSRAPFPDMEIGAPFRETESPHPYTPSHRSTSGPSSRAETSGRSSRQSIGHALARNHRQATPGPLNQQHEDTPSRSLSRAPFPDMETHTRFSPLGAIPEEDCPQFNPGSLYDIPAESPFPNTPSRHGTPGPSNRVPIPQPSFSRQASVGQEGAFPPTPGPSRQRATSRVPDNREDIPGPSIWQPEPFSSPFSSPHRQPSFSQGASSPQQGGNVLEAINRLGQKVNDMEDKIVHRIRSEMQPQPTTSRQTPRRDPSSPHKPKATRRIRDPARTSLQNTMRPMMNGMLGIRRDRDISTAVTEGHMVTEHEADSLLRNENGMMENLQYMRPLWSSIVSAYNDRLCSIFWTAFVEENPGFALSQEAARKYFKQRLTTLRALISSLAPAPGETDEQTTERNEANYLADLEKKRIRKRTWEGFSGRIEDVSEMAESDPNYEPVLDVLTELGVDGYSSDESCDEPEGYAVRWMPWRNRKLQKVVKKANQAHRTHGPNGNRLSGPSKRRRLYHSYPPVSSRQAPQELPINFYDHDWYNGLSPEEKRDLNPKPPMPFPGEHDGA